MTHDTEKNKITESLGEHRNSATVIRARIRKETPSEGGWQLSEVEIIGEFESRQDAIDFLGNDKFKMMCGEAGIFWVDNVKWPWARYYIDDA